MLDIVRALPGYRALRELASSGSPLPGSVRLPRSARGLLAAALADDLKLPVVLVASPDRLLVLEDEIRSWLPALPVVTFASPTPLFYEAEPWGQRSITQRAAVLARLGSGSDGNGEVILTAPRGLITRTLTPEQIERHSLRIRQGETSPLVPLADRLVAIGYRPSTLVLEPGQFSRRGGILDAWPPPEPFPVRIEFFGDEADSLRRFDPTEQRSRESIGQVRFPPAREALPGLIPEPLRLLLPADPGEADARLEFLLPALAEEPATLLDHLPPGSMILLDEAASIEAAVTELEEQAVEQARLLRRRAGLPASFPDPHQPLDELREVLEQRGAVDLGFLSGASDEAESPLEEAFSPGPRFAGQLAHVVDHLLERRADHDAVMVVSRQSDRLADLWSAEAGATPVDQLPAQVGPGAVVFVRGSLSDGWSVQRGPGRLHILTDSEIFGWGRPQPRRRPSAIARAPEASFGDLTPGDWVVHVDFGIGRYLGLVERTLEGVLREYLQVEYADGGEVFVPVHQADRLTRYVGAEGGPVHLSRLGSAEWERSKGDARKAVEEVARDLLELYAQRLAARGFAFPPDGAWQRELESSFPYEETEDQRRAVEAVRADMERARPMDRLICGDAGYGKTEVALRAAFKAVAGGKQAALLVPTTVLAQQHLRTFRQRLAAFPVEVEMLSRFRSRAETASIIERLAQGGVDIVIGTHRLLQRDVHFRDLGLLIIDEEQRFGVTHKEHLKRMRTEVDVLTLTATPIPRTLYLALTGARDISTINTPPEERLPVSTHIGAYDPGVVRQAVLRELDRGGQVFFVHNRVHSIEAVRRRLEGLLPEARLEIAHGQMPEADLAAVMDRFAAGEVDVLVSTSIIESGLDIPNANTLIVDRADHFGLAQLYQLRGRVGRGAVRGHAYLFRPGRTRAGDEALRRLEILAEQNQLGAGFSIAMQDLELRGAGEILGTRQHGHIAAIGFHLYTQLLTAAVGRLRQDERGPIPTGPDLAAAVDLLPAEVDLPLPAGLPATYISDKSLRVQLYRRLATLRHEAAIDGVGRELADRFGPPPPEVANLLYLLRLRLLVSQAGADGVSIENGQILVALPNADERLRGRNLGVEVRRSRRGLWLARSTRWESQLELLVRRMGELDGPRPRPTTVGR